MSWSRNLVVAVLATFGLVATDGASAATSSSRQERMAWELDGLRVVASGRTVHVPADPATGSPGGTLTSGYTLEGRARAPEAGTLFSQGTFRMTVSAFSPAQDMGGQKAGQWYVQGTWAIEDASGHTKLAARRHDPYAVKGMVSAVLAFNPTTEKRGWSADARVPMSLAAGRWARGDGGALSLDGKRKGSLSLVLEFRPGQ